MCDRGPPRPSALDGQNRSRISVGLAGPWMDRLFFRHQFWERLAANVGIVLLFGALFFRSSLVHELGTALLERADVLP